MKSPFVQIVHKNTFLEFRDEGVDADSLSDEEFMHPRRSRALTDSILECGTYSSRSSDAIASDEGESDCGMAERTRAASIETTCDSQAPLSDVSHSENEIVAEHMTDQKTFHADDAEIAADMRTGSEQRTGGQIYCTDAASAAPFFGMPLDTPRPLQPMSQSPGYVLCCMEGTAFVPMFAVANGMQSGVMHYPVPQTHVNLQHAANDISSNFQMGEVTLTTIMLRNLPNDYSREQALALLDSQGFAGRYDFFYLPMDFDRGANMGYAFVNFICHEDAVDAKVVFQGFSDWTSASQKVCEVSWGDPLQGREAHEDRYRNSPVMHESVPDHFRPVVFEAGVRVPFLTPTKRIRPPRRPPCAPRKKQGQGVVRWRW